MNSEMNLKYKLELHDEIALNDMDYNLPYSEIKKIIRKRFKDVEDFRKNLGEDFPFNDIEVAMRIVYNLNRFASKRNDDPLAYASKYVFVDLNDIYKLSYKSFIYKTFDEFYNDVGGEVKRRWNVNKENKKLQKEFINKIKVFISDLKETMNLLEKSAI